MSGNSNSSGKPIEKATPPLQSSPKQQTQPGQSTTPQQQANNAWRSQISASTGQSLDSTLETDQDVTVFKKMSSISSSGRSSSITSDGKQSKSSSSRKGSIGRVVDKAKATLNRSPAGAEMLADDDEQFEKMKKKEQKKEQKKEEYEKLGLGQQTRFGNGSVRMG